LNDTFCDSSRWVPITTSTARSQPVEGLVRLGVVHETTEQRHLHRKAREPSVMVAKCWLASSVVGTSTAACLLSWTALKMARTAISVLPNRRPRRSAGPSAAEFHIGLDVLYRLSLVGREV